MIYDFVLHCPNMTGVHEIFGVRKRLLPIIFFLQQTWLEIFIRYVIALFNVTVFYSIQV